VNETQEELFFDNKSSQFFVKQRQSVQTS
jgi:hypothetical protein